MKIRGNTVGTPIKPKKVLVKAESLTDDEKDIARENIGADVFYVTVTAAEDGTLTADKTFAEVKAAYNSGRTVVGMMDGYATPVSFVTDDCIEFSCFLDGTYTKGQLFCDNTVSVYLNKFPNTISSGKSTGIIGKERLA